MRLGPSAPRAWGPWQKAQLAANTGAPRFAAAGLGGGPNPRNSRTAWAPRGGPTGELLGCACANTTVGKQISSIPARARIVLLRRPTAVDDNIGAGDEACRFGA